MNDEQRKQAVDEIFEYIEKMFYIGEVKAWEEVKVEVCVDSMKKHFASIIAAHDKQPSGDAKYNAVDDEDIILFLDEEGNKIFEIVPIGHKNDYVVNLVNSIIANRDPGKVEALIEKAKDVVSWEKAGRLIVTEKECLMAIDDLKIVILALAEALEKVSDGK